MRRDSPDHPTSHAYGDPDAHGAPTAGPPPYHVFAIVPERAFGFPATGDAPPTRWTFPATTVGNMDHR